MWLWYVFIHKVIWAATAVYTDRFHFLLSSSVVDQPNVNTNASTRGQGVGRSTVRSATLAARRIRCGRRQRTVGISAERHD